MGPVVYLIIAALVIFTTLIIICRGTANAPRDRIMVIYGKVGFKSGRQQPLGPVHPRRRGLYRPIFQSFEYLDLTPISISVDLTNALSRQNIRIDVPSRFTVGISTEAGVMQNAAERLLGLKLAEIQALAQDIIFGQLRLVITTMDIEEINTDRDKFLEAISGNVETELKKIGLRLINVNVTDISDESGYIIALGREAAAKAINDAKKVRRRGRPLRRHRRGQCQPRQKGSGNPWPIRRPSRAEKQRPQGTDRRFRLHTPRTRSRRPRRAVSAEKIATAKPFREA
jgi:flotillin